MQDVFGSSGGIQTINATGTPSQSNQGATLNVGLNPTLLPGRPNVVGNNTSDPLLGTETKGAAKVIPVTGYGPGKYIPVRVVKKAEAPRVSAFTGVGKNMNPASPDPVPIVTYPGSVESDSISPEPVQSTSTALEQSKALAIPGDKSYIQ